MNPYQYDIQKFMEAMGQTVGGTPEIRDHELRAKLIMEEAVETCAALGFWAYGALQNFEVSPEVNWETEKEFVEPNELEVIDGICDLIYVTLGTAVAAGIDLDPFFAEVQRANMDKLTGLKREDGKQMKPEGWKPPDLAPILARQRAQDTFQQETEEWWSRRPNAPS